LMVKNKNEKYLRINIIVIKAERIYSKYRKDMVFL
jgi:hypothetical protein